MRDTKYCIFIIDIPKAWDTEDKIDKRKVLQTYLALETLKSGMVCDKRNRLKKRYLSRIPHIWVFTNTPPPRHAMSDDRWKIWTIKDLKLIPIKWEDLTGSTPVGATTSGSSDQQFEWPYLNSRIPPRGGYRKYRFSSKFLYPRGIQEIVD